jgi:hypothetical protein
MNLKKSALVFVEATKGLMLMSAFIHMVLLIGKAILLQDVRIMNYFRILDLQIIWPWLLENPYTDLMSLVVWVILYSAFLYWAYTKIKNQK